MTTKEKKTSSKKRKPVHVPFLAWYIVALPLAVGFMMFEFFMTVG